MFLERQRVGQEVRVHEEGYMSGPWWEPEGTFRLVALERLTSRFTSEYSEHVKS